MICPYNLGDVLLCLRSETSYFNVGECYEILAFQKISTNDPLYSLNWDSASLHRYTSFVPATPLLKALV